MTSAKCRADVEQLLASTGLNLRQTWQRKAKNEISFAHATGRLRAKANLRLPKETLLSFADPHVELKRLHEALDHAGYPAADTLEERLELKRTTDLEMLKRVTNRNTLPVAMALPNDFHNLKWLLKNVLLYQAEQQQQNNNIANILQEQTIPTRLQANLLTAGNWDVQKLWQDVLRLINKNSNCQVLPKKLACELISILQVYYNAHEIGIVTRRIDQLYFIYLAELAKSANTKSEREYILDYLALQADAANLQTVMRALSAHMTANELVSALVPGGEVSVTDIAELYPKLLPAMNASYDFNLVFKSLTQLYQNKQSASLLQALAYWAEPGERWRFSKAADELLLRLAVRGRANTYGCDAVAGLYLENMFEVKNLQLMLALRSSDKNTQAAELLRKVD